jgi:hypothetical protein
MNDNEPCKFKTVWDKGIGYITTDADTAQETLPELGYVLFTPSVTPNIKFPSIDELLGDDDEPTEITDL